ncbi:class I SAM-dependent methyltransferase [Alicyclobacillus fastidiosus]|uniref:Methyltransferase domain-containing protein n=1 Tax=Alicyclobacillus fastidiosus TaxID=392011 RepID=A0ABV5AK36_9BACL|nr:methyltransferase domain-containing protein [Alicyclobacillus fastidiosus]WEH07986.1 methyltransferase domain-containing protein [Alicyclobacillus fastidiosus]
MNQDKLDVYEQIGVAMTCRSFQEYVDMFQLSSDMFVGTILDVAAGASSFTAEANRKGFQSIAVDPRYALDPKSIYEHGKRETKAATEKLANLLDTYDWDYYGSLQAHEQNREHSLELFFEDYRGDTRHQRYVEGSLPNLPVVDNSFSLILCSHFLFLYEGQFNVQFHLGAIQELVRVCKSGGQILIYPLVTFTGEPYPQLDELKTVLKSEGIVTEQIPTTFRFLKGANHVLRITK